MLNDGEVMCCECLMIFELEEVTQLDDGTHVCLECSGDDLWRDADDQMTYGGTEMR